MCIIQKMPYPKYEYYPKNVLTLCFIFPLSETFDQHLFSLFSLKLMLNIKKWPPYFFFCLFVCLVREVRLHVFCMRVLQQLPSDIRRDRQFALTFYASFPV